LSDYIAYLNENDSEYDKYLSWKHNGVDNTYLKMVLAKRDTELAKFGFECHVCNKIHENLQRVKLGKPERTFHASKSHYGCPGPVYYHIIFFVGKWFAFLDEVANSLCFVFRSIVMIYKWSFFIKCSLSFFVVYWSRTSIVTFTCPWLRLEVFNANFNNMSVSQNRLHTEFRFKCLFLILA
jgi:hypothetical protein